MKPLKDNICMFNKYILTLRFLMMKDNYAYSVCIDASLS